MKTALVTGVSWKTGIGYAIVKQLINDGYYVYAIYHSNSSTAKEVLERDYPNRVKCIQCDLSNRQAVQGMNFLSATVYHQLN